MLVRVRRRSYPLCFRATPHAVCCAKFTVLSPPLCQIFFEMSKIEEEKLFPSELCKKSHVREKCVLRKENVLLPINVSAITYIHEFAHRQ